MKYQFYEGIPEEQRRRILRFFAECDEKERRGESLAPIISNRDNPQDAQSYDEYLQSPLWKKIKRRVLKRDGKICRRCGGDANMAHHRSYEPAVLKGEDDSELASVCQGCHNIIHFDDSGKRRTRTERDKVLFEQDSRTDFPPFKIDRRRGACGQKKPVGWERMNARQRSAWEMEVDLQWSLWQLTKHEEDTLADKIWRRALREEHGLKDADINLLIAQNVPRARRGSRLTKTQSGT